MSTKRHVPTEPSEPFPADEIETYHSPEPWTQDGRYIRDAKDAIVVRGRTLADARRIVAAINATRDIPTDALEHWLVQDVSDPGRPAGSRDRDQRRGRQLALRRAPARRRAGAAIPVPVQAAPAEPEPESWPYTLTLPSAASATAAAASAARPDPRPGPTTCSSTAA